jgi:MFS family permease
VSRRHAPPADIVAAAVAPDEHEPPARWLTPGVRGIGTASLLADLGHEIPTALLPSLLTTTLGAPAAALGVIEGVSDGLAGAARFGGGALADDPQRRRATAVGGYASTALLGGLIGVASSPLQAGALRAASWTARGLRVPARNALLADVVPAEVYGRAYGFERAMDNLGAVGGPLLALALVAAFSVRTAILLSIVPGLLAVAAILYAIRSTARPSRLERRPLRIRVRPVLRGDLGRLMIGIGAFEAGNIAATLLILRATEVLQPGHGHDGAVQIALLLYAGYNLAATLASFPAGRLVDGRGAGLVLTAGVVLFLVAYVGFAATGPSVALLAACFAAAGVAIGCVETAEHAAVARLAPADLRGSAFGLLAAVQSFGNLVASAVAGALWTLVSPAAGLLFAAALMAVALAALSRPAGRS